MVKPVLKEWPAPLLGNDKGAAAGKAPKADFAAWGGKNSSLGHVAFLVVTSTADRLLVYV
jgi:hypothetical protein